MKKVNIKATLKRYDENRYFHRADFDIIKDRVLDSIMKNNIKILDESIKNKKK